MMATREFFSIPIGTLARVYTAGRYPLDEMAHNYRYESPTHALHVHDYFGQMRLGNRLYPLRPGTYSITPANVPSTYALREPGHHWCVHFLPARSGKSRRFRIPLIGELGTSKAFAAERILQIGRALRGASAPRGRGAPLAAAWASVQLQDLLLWLGSTAAGNAQMARSKPFNRATAAVEKAAELIDARFSDRDLTMPDLADAVGMTQNYLAARFRRRFGMTMPRYLLNKRLEHARLLLATTNLPINRIALRVGFADSQHFNKQFRRLVGRSPSAWRSDR